MDIYNWIFIISIVGTVIGVIIYTRRISTDGT
jgi:hypothetical protein